MLAETEEITHFCHISIFGSISIGGWCGLPGRLPVRLFTNQIKRITQVKLRVYVLNVAPSGYAYVNV